MEIVPVFVAEQTEWDRRKIIWFGAEKIIRVGAINLHNADREQTEAAAGHGVIINNKIQSPMLFMMRNLNWPPKSGQRSQKSNI